MTTHALRLQTADDEVLHAEHRPGPTDGVGVVVAHGFTGAVHKPDLRRVADALAGHAGVVTFDFRGHGRSSGLSTVGDREILDLDAAVAAARSFGYAAVVTVGFSMGGSVALRHAALHGVETVHAVDAVVSVSAPSRWYVRDTASMRRVHWMVERRLGRVVTRVALRTRVASAWDSVPESPRDVVGRISPVPLLLVHGDADQYFTVEHPQALLAAAKEPVELWLEPGLGHAEVAVGAELLERIGRHLPVLLSQRVPRRRSHDGDAAMTVTLRYWAAAKAAAGTDQQVVDAGTLADALAKARQRQDGKLSLVLERCSFLVDGDPVGGRDHDQVLLPAGSVVDVLPPFAGG